MSTIKLTPDEIRELSLEIQSTSTELYELHNRIRSDLSTFLEIGNGSSSLSGNIVNTMSSLDCLPKLAEQLRLISQEGSTIATQYQAANAAVFKDFS